MNNNLTKRPMLFTIMFIMVSMMVISAEASTRLLYIPFGDRFGANDGTIELHGEIAAGTQFVEQDDGKIVVIGPSTRSHQYIAVNRYWPDGSRDLSFDGNGTTQIFVGEDVKVHQVAIQPDRRIVIVGQQDDGHKVRLLVVRLNADGSLDNLFNGTGIWIWDDVLGAPNISRARDVAVTPGGKIVIVGYICTPAFDCLSESKMAIWQLAPFGTLDPTFDSDGVALFEPFNAINIANGLVIQDDGNIVVTGVGSNEADPFRSLFVARVTPTGSYDDTFSTDGVIRFGGNAYSGEDIVIQPDGKIVFGGTNLIGRLHSDGTLDSSFGGGDGLVHTIGGNAGYPNLLTELALRDDGHLLAFGKQININRIVLMQPNGQIDPQFGNDGVVSEFHSFSVLNDFLRLQSGRLLFLAHTLAQQGTQPVMVGFHPDGSRDSGGRMVMDNEAHPNLTEMPTAVAVSATNDIYVAGIAEPLFRNSDDFALLRFDRTGELDQTFQAQPVENFTAGDMEIDGAGRIVIAGQLSDSPGFHLRRYFADSTLDFAVTLPLSGGGSMANSLLVQSNNRYLVGGVSGFDFTIARFLENGTLDTSFGVNGVATHSFGGLFESVTNLAFAPDGKIIAQGVSGNPVLGSNQVVMTRFSADGIHDPSFTDFVLNATNQSTPTGLAVQPDGKIVSVGQINENWAVWRQLSDGSIDLSFGSTGYTYPVLQQAIVFDVAVQPDGTIVSVGCVTEDQQHVTTVVRQLPDGLRDLSFDADGRGEFIFGTRAECARLLAPMSDSGTDDLLVVGHAEVGADNDVWTLMRIMGSDTVPSAVQVSAFSAENSPTPNILIYILLLTASLTTYQLVRKTKPAR